MVKKILPLCLMELCSILFILFEHFQKSLIILNLLVLGHIILVSSKWIDIQRA